MTDYSQFYDLESYLLTTVNSRFHSEGCLSAFDFFCVIAWKANRAISRVAKRLVPDADRARDALEGVVVSARPADIAVSSEGIPHPWTPGRKR